MFVDDLMRYLVDEFSRVVDCLWTVSRFSDTP